MAVSRHSERLQYNPACWRNPSSSHRGVSFANCPRFVGPCASLDSYSPTVATWNHSPKGSQNKLKTKYRKNNNKKWYSFWERFRGLWGPARMPRPLEMYIASRIQNMVQIRARNACFATKLYFCFFFLFSATIIPGLSALRAPHGGVFFFE